MPALIDHYPYRKKRDLRSAMAETLAAHLAGLEFTAPAYAEPRKFRQVFYEWAAFERYALAKAQGGSLPAAAVLPDTADQGDSSLTPRVLEDTWRTDGTDGYALVEIAEKIVPFLVVVRATSKAERQAIISAVEDAFVASSTLKRPTPVAYGLQLTMASYYERKARYTLLRHTLLDQEVSAQESRRLAQFEIQAQAQHVVLRRIPAMDARVQVVVDGELA